MRSLPATTAALAIGALSLGCTTGTETPDPSKLEPWAHALDSAAFPTALASGPDGSLFIGGLFSGEADFGGGALTAGDPDSMFLAYYDPNGQHIMSGATGAADTVTATAIGPDGTSCAVGNITGSMTFPDGTLNGSGDGWLACFDATGAALFSKLIRSELMIDLQSVAIAPNGNIVIGLETDRTVDFGAGPASSSNEAIAVIAELTPEGDPLWDYRIFANPLFPVQVGVGPDGSVAFTTGFEAPISFGLETFTTGTVIGKLDATGKPLWGVVDAANVYGYLRFRSFSVDEGGNVVVAGWGVADGVDFAGLSVPQGNSDAMFVAKISPEGQGLWIRPITAGDDLGLLVFAAPAPGGDVLVAANSYSPVDFGAGPVETSPAGQALALARLSPDGAVEQTLSVSSDGGAAVWYIAADPKGQAVLMGIGSGDVQFGPAGGTELNMAQGGPFLARVAF